PPMDLLLTHAEDQLMSAEAFGILADKFITLYQKVNR
ncbi:MAG: PTS lactose/cellobiose transporter subunit IIA, partial [Erysipelotrichaceae bacterium]|nr:PTS lactose/cellobiose transporter subunit IIA [Erysipelotrichaceae bacterium]